MAYVVKVTSLRENVSVENKTRFLFLIKRTFKSARPYQMNWAYTADKATQFKSRESAEKWIDEVKIDWPISEIEIIETR